VVEVLERKKVIALEGDYKDPRDLPNAEVLAEKYPESGLS